MEFTKTFSLQYVQDHPYLVGGGVIVLYYLYKFFSLGSRHKSLPPGPPTIPLLGNAHLIPTVPTEKHVYYDKLAQEYGDVFTLKLFNKTMIVVNSARASYDLLDKRSQSFNDRPDTYILDGYIAQGKHIVLTNGKKNTMLRRVWLRTLAPGVIDQHRPIQNAEAVATVFNILNNPNDFYEELQRYSCSVATVVSYGKRAPTFRGVDKSGFSCQEFYRLDEEFLKLLEVGIVPLFDMIPILKVLPGPWNAIKKHATQLKNETDEFFWKQYKETKRKMAKGEKSGSWLENLIEDNVDGLDEDMLSWQGGIMLSGASSTAANTLLTLILVCVTHPRATKKAQEELDSVIGQDRLPTFEDIDSLPYTKAFIQEIMRYRPTAPGGSPHLTTKDEVYKGYVIPKDSFIVGNTWGIMNDHDFYENPEEFWPERYVQNEFGLKKGADTTGWRNTYTFGAGRRICPGLHFAENELKIVVPKLLHAFTFTPVGKLSTNWSAYIQRGTLAAPLPFECVIKPRSPALLNTVKSEYEHVRPFLENYNPEF